VTSDSSGQSDPQQQIILQASSDPEFRNRLLQDPKAAIEEQLGIQVPASVLVRVVEEEPGEVVLVLPAQGMAPGTQLSDAELEGVAGGADTWIECTPGNM
jgi:hypothetical protein